MALTEAVAIAGVGRRVLDFLRKHLPAFILLLPLMFAIFVGMSIKGDNKALRLQVKLEEGRTAAANAMATERQATIMALEQRARLQHDLQEISDERHQRSLTDVAYYRAAAERLRRQAAETGCVVPAQPAGILAGAASGDGLEDGAGNADRLADLFEEADRTTQKLIGIQATWALMEKRVGCGAGQ